MRSIEGRKYHLLYLLFIFVFDAFCRPRLQNEFMWRYGKALINQEFFFISINTCKKL